MNRIILTIGLLAAIAVSAARPGWSHERTPAPAPAAAAIASPAAGR